MKVSVRREKARSRPLKLPFPSLHVPLYSDGEGMNGHSEYTKLVSPAPLLRFFQAKYILVPLTGRFNIPKSKLKEASPWRRCSRVIVEIKL